MTRALLALCVFAPLSALADDRGRFLREDVFELESAADPRISPDGARVAYVRRSADIMTDRVRSNIWIVDADGGNHRPLLSGADSYTSPRWSPDGGRLAYVSSAEGRGPELYVRWMDTGQTALLSNLAEAPGSVAWSPDGRSIAFTALVKDEPEPMVKPPARPEGAEWAPPVAVIEELAYRADGRGYLDAGRVHVFVIPAEGGTPRRLTEGDYDHGGALAWSPDGSSIVFSANRNEDWRLRRRDTDLWSVDARSGEMRRLTERDGPDFAPVFSPDGSRLAYLGYDDRRMGHHNTLAHVMDLDSGAVSAPSEGLDRSVGAVAWAGDGARLLVSYDDFGARRLASLGLEGDLRVLADDVGGVDLSRPYTSGGWSAAADGSYAYTASTPHRPADVAVGRAGANARLTRLNEDLLGGKRLGEVEEIRWRSSAGGLEVQGWLVTPPDFDPGGRHPLLLEIHGGPFAAYGPYFSTEAQLYAAAGYVVLYANPRGSTGYGDAFANEIHRDYPGRDYDDLMSGVDAVVDRGFIDPERLFVTGGSGGGVLTSWIIGNTGRFAAAVVAKPVINWASHALYSDIPETVARYWFERPPWEDYRSYWERSPLSLVGNVSTPTMLLTGEEDHRTPMAESEQYYQALKLREVDAALVRVPGAAHSIAARPSHQIAKADHILAWFGRYGGGRP